MWASPNDFTRGTRKTAVNQAHMVVALGRLEATEAIPVLLEVLRDPGKKHTIRRSAASALGILADTREKDLLFEIDACTNPYGFILATRELVRTR